MTTVDGRGSEFTTSTLYRFATLSQHKNLPPGSSRSSANHELVSRTAVKDDHGIGVTVILLLVMLFISPLRQNYSPVVWHCGCGVFACLGWRGYDGKS